MKPYQSRNLKKQYQLGQYAELYQSDYLTQLKEEKPDKKDRWAPIELDFGPLRVWVPRHFGFCKGVENAIEVAYQTLEQHPDEAVFMISELIHNPFVNADLHNKGLRFIKTATGKQLIPWEEISKGSIVITPAFGATLEDEQRLADRGVDLTPYNATCRFVENVWFRSEELGQKGFTIIVHGKFRHEETQATFSHSKMHGPTLVVLDMEEAQWLIDHIAGKYSKEEFFQFFEGKFSEGFDPDLHLSRLAVVNQTTMLASETSAIADLMKEAMRQKFGEEQLSEHFANTRDTLCYATKNNQAAMLRLLEQQSDLAIIVGGTNSSNTSHLVELAEMQVPTYFIASEDDLLAADKLRHYDFRAKTHQQLKQYLPEVVGEKVNVLIGSGASCPDAIVERVIKRLASFFPASAPPEQILYPQLNS